MKLKISTKGNWVIENDNKIVSKKIEIQIDDDSTNTESDGYVNCSEENRVASTTNFNWENLPFATNDYHFLLSLLNL